MLGLKIFINCMILMSGWLHADPLRPGGEMTHRDLSKNAFSHPGPNVKGVETEQFFVGNSFFKKAWVSSPSSTLGRDGLGPTFNATACASCHGLDGRGVGIQVSASSGNPVVNLSLLFRLSEVDDLGQVVPHSDYGEQLNPGANIGIPSEAQPQVMFEKVPGRYPDGTVYELRKPIFTFSDFAFKPFDHRTLVSPRVAPHMIGLGLVEAIPEAKILALADPDDLNQDGISGRANRVLDLETGGLALGRFGWKAGQPSLRQQNAAAFLGDIGITTSLFPVQNCPPVQILCLEAYQNDGVEADDSILLKVTTYTQALGVPERRDAESPDVVAGEKLFRTVGCTGCHTPQHQTGDGAIEAVKNQTIYPYSDFLLHDMGEDLADGRPEAEATGTEWRTPPLWGVGLFQKVSKHQNLLHDARARGVEEAILWHGGEAEASREAFKNLVASERAQVVLFINSL